MRRAARAGVPVPVASTELAATWQHQGQTVVGVARGGRLLGLLGGAAVAAVAQRGARTLASLLPSSVRDQAKGLMDRARDAARDAGADPWALLGFDPLALWAQLRHLYRA